MNNLDIAYNTEKPLIRYPEYGRGIEDLLAFAKKIEDPMKRQKTVETIVGMMQLLNPNRTNMEDYREKLWNHAFAIAGNDLDVTPPPGITIRHLTGRPKPDTVPYPKLANRMRHYGINVQKLIQKAIEMPEGPKREGFVEVIASYMKLAYKTWNREHYVSDDVIKDDLEILSNGQLELHEGHSSLDILAASVSKNKDLQRQNSPSQGRNKKPYKNRKQNYSNYRKQRKKNT
ncbi:MAG: DUF4290 domain-containing protein [Lewinellaceae bacterium]|nr:DUF4290 domain-containing protein [Lewinellaceae bacterium]